MKAEIKSGHNLLFIKGCSNSWSNLIDTMIVNFNERWSFIGFIQIKDHLLIETKYGKLDIVFTPWVPILKFDHQEKDQVIFTFSNIYPK